MKVPRVTETGDAPGGYRVRKKWLAYREHAILGAGTVHRRKFSPVLKSQSIRPRRV